MTENEIMMEWLNGSPKDDPELKAAFREMDSSF